MNTNLSPALDILYEAESARKEGCGRVCELLSLDPTSTIAGILVAKEQRLGAFDTSLLETIAKIVEDHNIKRNITDWPFEHFWGNPYEPRHSKLLKYFIDPDEEHHCGAFLLEKLFEVLKKSNSLPTDRQFPVEHCQISQSDYIDLLIERDCKDGKYAIVIENKINWAVDRKEQLQRYVKSVIKRNFDAKQIFVFYLPLTEAKDPNPKDVEAVTKKLGVKYYKITFETHILNWLNAVLDNELPAAMKNGMRENISHYRNLIRYLINKQKEHKMNHEILKHLQQSEEEKPLPTWSQVESLQKSAGELKQCLESVLRGKLLLKIQRLLREKKVDSRFYLSDGTAEKKILDSPYDEWFGGERNLGIQVSKTVLVCFGSWPEKDPGEIFWTGYMKNGDSDEQEVRKDMIIKEAQRYLKNLTKTNSPWYVWDWNKEINYDNCVKESTADRIANMLLEMQDSLVGQLKEKDAQP